VLNDEICDALTTKEPRAKEVGNVGMQILTEIPQYIGDMT